MRKSIIKRYKSLRSRLEDRRQNTISIDVDLEIAVITRKNLIMNRSSILNHLHSGGKSSVSIEELERTISNQTKKIAELTEARKENKKSIQLILSKLSNLY